MSAPVEEPLSGRVLTQDDVRTELSALDLSPSGSVGNLSAMYARRINGEGGDLLHDAVHKALSSRRCPEEVPVEQFLAGIMRSATSTIRRSRERRRDQYDYLPLDYATERLALGGCTTKSADELIEIERVQTLCAEVIDKLADGSAEQALLIDGIALELRGRELADHLGVSLRDLATLRKALKRRIIRIWPDVKKEIEGGRTPRDR